jgi:hypothetical protein
MPIRIVLDSLPESVHALDAVLNRLIVTAETDRELHDRMTAKLRIKRELMMVSDAMLDAAARATLAAVNGLVCEIAR